MPVEINVRVSSIDKLTPEMQEVITDLNSHIPEASSAIIYFEVTGKGKWATPENVFSNRSASRLLQESSEVCGLFPKRTSRKKPSFTSPNTWAVGSYEAQEKEPSKWGLFLRLEGFYDKREVKKVLGGDRVDHTRLDLKKLTGRIPGTVSPLLERKYLQAVDVIHFQPVLIEHLNHPDTTVDFPLDNYGHFYLARGREFLAGYARLMNKYGIPTNLGNT